MPLCEVLCILLALFGSSQSIADDDSPPKPVSIRISDDQPASPSDLHATGAAANVGPSPYADWSGQGQPLTTNREDQLAEIHPAQADWINAAFAQLDYRSDAHYRAGWPECIRSRAIPSDTGRYCGYYVGGGAVLHYEGRYLDEGTWGWDYMGLCFRKRVALDWWHGRYQGGAGQYQTDGPKLRHE